MRRREWGALFLVWLTACAGSPQRSATSLDPYEAELKALRYELQVLTSGAVDTEPVEVDEDDFQGAASVLARHVPASERPRETARWLMEEELQADLLAEVEYGRVVRLVPLEEDSSLSVASNAKLLVGYQHLCAEQYEGGDCLGLTADGPVLDRDDRRTLALAFAFGGVLQETRASLKQMVSLRAVLALVVGAAMLYFMLWIVPEPVTKGVAALISIGLLAWLGAQTLWELMDGWGRLVTEADRATTFEELEKSGRKFSKVMGENTARVVVLVVTAAVGGGAARFSQRLPLIPGYGRAAAQAEAQGMRLAAAGEVESVAAPAEGTFTLMVRSPGSQAAAAEARGGVVTIIRHQGGNRQVLCNNNQRWHVPAGRSIKDIPPRDPVGDDLVAAAKVYREQWGREDLSREAALAITNARAKGEHWLANLLEVEARGRFVHAQLKLKFPHLKWSHKGVDAVDPTTGIKYEILTRTESNMARHGRRMAEELFRMIGF
ncbi:SitA5 family polymorphic toxin [Hyalangium versicolor]|uniref:SitA5 family polymorphic toxin n=1 Tax=Hyalangium versicolor TaxID=2861190 RepID=UPI001CCF5B98|nr:hypothetical protein [Hyalangium versicolor]